jgi:hypothetical protein
MLTRLLLLLGLLAPALPASDEGPLAALRYAESFRGAGRQPGQMHLYPDARGIPFEETRHFISLTSELWRPADLAADFRRRAALLPSGERPRGIIVVLKTERCATKRLRACTVTTAALEKRSTPLAASFLLYGVWLQPRDDDHPPGSRAIETGADAWKNEAAGVYEFDQGPGATIVFLDPRTGQILERTDARAQRLFDAAFTGDSGRTTKLHETLARILARLESGQASGAAP